MFILFNKTELLFVISLFRNIICFLRDQLYELFILGYRSLSLPSSSPMKSKHSKCSLVSESVENIIQKNEQLSKELIQDFHTNEDTGIVL